MYRTRLFTVVAFAGVLAFGTAALTQCSPGVDPNILPPPTTTTTTVAAPVCGPADPVGTVEPVSVKGLNACAALSQSVEPGWNAAISADGRYVAFVSTSSRLVKGDTNGEDDVFVRDRLTGAVERASVTSSGAEAPPPLTHNTSDVFGVAISADGRYVTFNSQHALAPGAVESCCEMNGYLHDRQTGTTELVSIAPDGSTIPTAEVVPSQISDDGRYVAFESGQDFYVRDRVAATTTMIDTNQSTGGSWPALSGNGRYVAFISASPNLVPGDTNGSTDVFVYDLVAQTTERVDVTTNGDEAEGAANWSFPPSISDDGRYVAFTSQAWNLYGLTSAPTSSADMPGFHVYVHDRVANTTTRADTLPAQSMGTDAHEQSISDDGRYVAYMCTICGGDNPDDEVLLTDMTTGQTRRVGTSPEGVVSNGADRTTSVKGMSGDGHWLLFNSTATNLAPLDPNVPSNNPGGANEDLFLQHIN